MSDRLTQAQQRLQEIASATGYFGRGELAVNERSACDLGAQCVALVQQLQTFYPYILIYGLGRCSFCGSVSPEHADNCLWRHARQLTEGEK